MRQRVQVPNPVIDEQEELWWNENAEIIEFVWAHPENIRQAVRNHYMKKVKQFFLSNSKTKPVSVLEVGCGSGWVGRMIADSEMIKIIGLDLSEKQIDIANQNALLTGLNNCCEYYCQNLADFVVTSNKKISCVLIHAILHHLSWQEIHNVLSQIASIGKDTKIFVYEPVYLETTQNSFAKGRLKRITNNFAQQLMNFPNVLAKSIVQNKQQYYNQEQGEKLNLICKKAQENGWVLSPKEIVFQETELLEVLNQYFDVKERYLCNHTSFSVGQIAALYNNEHIGKRFNNIVLPLAKIIDNFLFNSGLLQEINNNYVFMGYQCIVR